MTNSERSSGLVRTRADIESLCGLPRTYAAEVNSDSREQPLRWYRVLAAALVAAACMLCAAAVWLGRKRGSDALTYFYPAGDRGHPGVVAVATAVGFFSIAMMGGMLSLSATRPEVRRGWVGLAVLFAAVAADDLLQLHALLPLGDLIARPLYWGGLFLVTRRLAPVLRGRQGRSFLVLGVGLLALSELVDFFPHGDDPSYRFHQIVAVTEESALTVGAWSLAAAFLGFALTELAQVPVTPDEAAAPAQLRRG